VLYDEKYFLNLTPKYKIFLYQPAGLISDSFWTMTTSYAKNTRAFLAQHALFVAPVRMAGDSAVVFALECVVACKRRGHG